MNKNKKRVYLIIMFLFVACCIVFGRIIDNDFINFDDPGYITENNHVQSGISLQNIQWAFTTIVLSNWHPITLISHMMDWSLFGANAAGHHLVSLLLHIGAVIFLFLFLNKTTNNLWPSAFAAAFFALHPLRVESVAWAAERKDVLSMLFGMAALYAYAFYAESSKYSRYFICLILFALSLLSKPMLVTLPFLLLLLDYWPLKRWQKAIMAPVENRFKPAYRLVWEKVPFLLLTIASSMTTFYAQNRGGAVSSAVILPFLMRLANAIVSYVGYLVKTFYPIKLAVFYPYQFSMPLLKVLFSTIILVIITFAVFYSIKKLPFLFVGWFWYLGTLIPVIGLVQIGSQSMADRYTYLPSIGISIMLAWGIPLLFWRINIREKILFPVAIAVLFSLSVLTWMQCGYWRNSITLFGHALSVTKDNYIAHSNYGLSLFTEGKVKQAIGHYNKAIALSQSHAAEFYTNRGIAYDHLGQHQRSLEDYNEAIRLKPDLVFAYNNRGNTYHKLGHHQLAINDYNKAIQLKPDDPVAYNNRGGAYYVLGQYQSAIDDCNKVIQLKPDYVDAYRNRAVAYFKMGDKNPGCLDAQKACELGNCKTLAFARENGYCR